MLFVNKPHKLKLLLSKGLVNASMPVNVVKTLFSPAYKAI
jgi:hypothetical protein